jgi:glycosyltransferase involved in cell wall biosynthesis
MSNNTLAEEYPFCHERYAITVCRIEPENNIHLILQAFSRQTEVPLVMIGNWEGSSYGLNLVHEYMRLSHIRLLNPIYDIAKINFLRSHAQLYIHGHSAGGTNPSLVEAMFLGLPIFAFDCIYNRYTTENQCVYWANPEELFDDIINRDEIDLVGIGTRMKMIASNRYRWDIVVSKYEGLFMRNSVTNYSNDARPSLERSHMHGGL